MPLLTPPPNPLTLRTLLPLVLPTVTSLPVLDLSPMPIRVPPESRISCRLSASSLALGPSLPLPLPVPLSMALPLVASLGSKSP